MLPFLGNFPAMSVPTLDVSFRGKNTPIDLFANAYFVAGTDGAYQYVRIAIIIINIKHLRNRI